MANKYPETNQTFEALKNLGAESQFISFNNIFNEVKRIRLSNNLKENPVNLKTRVRRSLFYDQKSLKIKEALKERKDDSQVKLVSIALMYPQYEVKSRNSIILNKYGDANTKDVEENSYMLIKK
jgi:hypothetical protein